MELENMQVNGISEAAKGERAANARIRRLIESANVPVMIAKNTVESPEIRKEALRRNVNDIVRDNFSGDVYAYISSLVNTIDRLENALISVLAREKTADVFEE